MYYEVLEQLTRDRQAELTSQAEQSRLATKTTSVQRRAMRRVLATVTALLRSRESAARAESQA